mgnify:CR=1 FL=1
MVLPHSILDWFDITNIDDACVPDLSGNEVFSGTLHIYLDERDNRPADMQELRSKPMNGEYKSRVPAYS